MTQEKKKTKKTKKSSFNWVKITSIVGGSFFLVFLILIIFAPQPNYKHGFKTLSDLEAHAKTLDEWRKMEGKNILKPSFEKYYKESFELTFGRKLAGKISWLRSLIGLKKTPIFSVSFFKNILDRVRLYREKQNYKGDFIHKITLNPQSKIIIFGSIHGSFHQLVRYLRQLNKLNIIDENLKIQSPDYYIASLGNGLLRSPYTLETFGLFLRLLEQNPENIIHMKGTNASFDYWKNRHTLERELTIRARHLSKSEIPLSKEVQQFFDSLSITLYATIPFQSDKVLNYFKLAPYIRDEKLKGLLEDVTYAKFIKEKTGQKLAFFDLKNRAGEPDSESENVMLKAIIREIRKRDEFVPNDGLRQLPSEEGVPAWAVMSSAIEAIRVPAKFFYDAFAIVEPGKTLDHWTITLYNRDIRNKNDLTFKKRQKYFFTGLDIGHEPERKPEKKVVKEEKKVEKKVAPEKIGLEKVLEPIEAMASKLEELTDKIGLLENKILELENEEKAELEKKAVPEKTAKKEKKVEKVAKEEDKNVEEKKDVKEKEVLKKKEVEEKVEEKKEEKEE